MQIDFCSILKYDKLRPYETIRDNIKLVFNILGQSHITKHIQQLSKDIQVHLAASVNPVRTLGYLEL